MAAPNNEERIRALERELKEFQQRLAAAVEIAERAMEAVAQIRTS